MVEERKREKYVCLRCGNVYESRAKKPQCPVCRSKKKMKFEEFLALPEESQKRILGKHKGEKEGEIRGNKGETGEMKGENKEMKGDDRVKNEGLQGEKERVKGEDRVKVGGSEGDDREIKGEIERVEVEKVVENEGVKGENREKKSDDRGKEGEKERVKKGEKAKGERGKLAIPKPKLSLKAIGFISALVFIYMLYKMGFLESAIERLKSLGAFRSVGNNEEEIESVERNPILERVKKNLSG